MDESPWGSALAWNALEKELYCFSLLKIGIGTCISFGPLLKVGKASFGLSLSQMWMWLIFWLQVLVNDGCKSLVFCTGMEYPAEEIIFLLTLEDGIDTCISFGSLVQVGKLLLRD